MKEKRNVRVFAAYQIGTGIYSKMVGDECKNKFEVTFGPTSEMVREIEGILNDRHACDVKKGMVVVIHHFQLISF